MTVRASALASSEETCLMVPASSAIFSRGSSARNDASIIPNAQKSKPLSAAAESSYCSADAKQHQRFDRKSGSRHSGTRIRSRSASPLEFARRLSVPGRDTCSAGGQVGRCMRRCRVSARPRERKKLAWGRKGRGADCPSPLVPNGSDLATVRQLYASQVGPGAITFWAFFKTNEELVWLQVTHDNTSRMAALEE